MSDLLWTLPSLLCTCQRGCQGNVLNVYHNLADLTVHSQSLTMRHRTRTNQKAHSIYCRLVLGSVVTTNKCLGRKEDQPVLPSRPMPETQRKLGLVIVAC